MDFNKQATSTETQLFGKLFFAVNAVDSATALSIINEMRAAAYAVLAARVANDGQSSLSQPIIDGLVDPEGTPRFQ